MERSSVDWITIFEKHNAKSLKIKELSLKMLEKLISLSSHIDVSNPEKYKIYSESISNLSKVVVESDFLIDLNTDTINWWKKRLIKF
jgi:hypothetical protein